MGSARGGGAGRATHAPTHTHTQAGRQGCGAPTWLRVVALLPDQRFQHVASQRRVEGGQQLVRGLTRKAVLAVPHHRPAPHRQLQKRGGGGGGRARGVWVLGRAAGRVRGVRACVCTHTHAPAGGALRRRGSHPPWAPAETRLPPPAAAAPAWVGGRVDGRGGGRARARASTWVGAHASSSTGRLQHALTHTTHAPAQDHTHKHTHRQAVYSPGG